MVMYETYTSKVTFKPQAGEVSPKPRVITAYLLVPQYTDPDFREVGTLAVEARQDAARTLAHLRSKYHHNFANGIEGTTQSKETREVRMDPLPPDEYEQLVSEVNALLAGI